MSEKITRRSAFCVLGLGALSLAVLPTVLTVSNAEAQQPTPETAPQTGTERREERREHRGERREERRTGTEEKK
jgi:hypothetical protein